MAEFVVILLSTAFINNVVLTKFLGLCPFLGVSNKLDQALGMDGPAFYRARDGIDQLKDSGDLIRLEGLPDRWVTLAEGSLRLLSKWIPETTTTRTLSGNNNNNQ